MANEKKYISSIKRENTKYLVKDKKAREDVQEMETKKVSVDTNVTNETLVFTIGPQNNN